MLARFASRMPLGAYYILLNRWRLKGLRPGSGDQTFRPFTFVVKGPFFLGVPSFICLELEASRGEMKRKDMCKNNDEECLYTSSAV